MNFEEKSRYAYFGNSGCLEYYADEENNYIPNFSFAGYQNGNTALPEMAVVKTLNPVAGDNTAHIQAALDSLATLPLNENNNRGALLLNAGEYEIHGQLFIRESGIVLRGVGNGATANNTILKGIGNLPARRNLIVAGGSSGVNWTREKSGTKTNITNTFVPAGSRSLELASVTPFQIGDEVIVFQPSTAEWLASIDHGATADDEGWKPGEIDLFYKRKIANINVTENKVILDVPIFDHLNRELSQAVIYVLDEPGIKRNIGIENLRIDIETEGELSENHIKSGIELRAVTDCWVKGVTVLHFMYAGIFTTLASQVTIRDCQAIDPHSKIEGSRRYNFAVNKKSNNILFENCQAIKARHAFVSNGASSVSGIVFYNCTAEQDYNSSEGHRRWSQGLLFDNIVFTKPNTSTLLGLYNRGDYGTGHGWASVNSLAWHVNTNSNVEKIIIQKPPQRQNYAIACNAYVTNEFKFMHDKGVIELSMHDITPISLYQAQLLERQQNGLSPDAPADLRSNYESDTKIVLNWLDIAADELGYQVQISKDDGQTFETIADLPNNTITYSFENVDTVLGNLIFRVFAYNENCRSPYSNETKLEKIDAVEELSIPDLVIYPNPVTAQLFYKGNSPLRELIVYDVQGEIVFHQSGKLSSSASLDMTGLQAGVYMLSIEDDLGRKGIYKLVKR
ncbi:MAG TPA: T9SS type A sorting domain-containing protein [Saprospiraceae bacterium]|nr:T9SS type A sorting domain-containing protein [Saprospiraceae bacterium]